MFISELIRTKGIVDEISISRYLDAIKKIEGLTQDISFEAFTEDEMGIFAVVRAL